MPLFPIRITPTQRLSLAVWIIVLGAVPAVRFPLKSLAEIRESNGQHEIATALQQFAALAPALPPGERVGYLNGRAGNGSDASSGQGRRALAQHALLPRVIERSSETPWVIFDSDNPQAAPPRAVDGRWLRIADTGTGVSLYRTEIRQ